ncbi:MAG TPA: PEP/pyruvate-binding domain-containing protein [Mycobacteriales bacterium]|nr:PEP/pyruvate-binding domain-containing protein [Mycobacteriales bacterium]
MGRLIGPGDDRLLDATLVGHKFARQERLRRAGFPVPALACVPVSEFDAVAATLPPPPADSGAAPEWAAAVAKRLAASEVDSALTAELLAAAEGLGGTLAVRACVVAGEDGAGEDSATDPFAGLTDSYLYVSSSDVPRKVAECWASGLNPESVAYRAHRGLPAQSARVAVGVQQMVLGARSFVAFSRDPRSGGRVCVVAAAHGIGEGVVAERADVDHFFLESRTGAVRSEVVAKHRMVGEGSVDTVVPAALVEPPVLTEAEVRAVGALAARVEDFFGAPQDIEGAITPDGTLHLVQARPVVLPADGEPVEWSNHNITESFPGVSGALTYSHALLFYRLAFGDLYRRMGSRPSRLRPVEHELDRMIGLLDGRVFYRLDSWFALHGTIPGFVLIRPWWLRSMGLEPGPRASWVALARAGLAVPGLVSRLVRLPGSVRSFLRWWDGLVESFDDVGDDELVAFHRRMWDGVGRRWGVTLVNSFFLLGTATALSALLRRWAGPSAEEQILGGLLVGGREHRSVLAVRSTIALAERIGRDPWLRDRLLSPADGDTDAAIWTDIAGGRYGTGLAAEATAHLRRYGDRALHDLKLEEPAPRQRPSMLVDMLRPMVAAGLTVKENRRSERAARADAERALREACPGLRRRLVIRGLAAGLRRFVRNREDTRYCRSQLYSLSREITWRLGGMLASSGRIEDPRDVLDLTVDEVLTPCPTADLAVIARRRRADREAARERPDPESRVWTSDGESCGELPGSVAPGGWRAGSSSDGARTASGDELRGLPSSAGVVRGRAAVVLDPSRSPDSARDRILVAKETDPGWLFLMMAARGLVVERGTLLSHTAITGRLLGIPTVVAVPGATERIQDEQELEVDGSTGTVRLIGPEPDSEAA